MLKALLHKEAIPPFVYCYPPRSAYLREETPSSVADVWDQDLQYSGNELNLYLHVPFCRYRCGFCNLYTVIEANPYCITQYAKSLSRQLRLSSEIIQRRVLRTVYIGGGTPSLMQITDLDLIFKELEDLYPSWRNHVEEVAIEASPDSLAGASGAAYAQALRSIGLTRVNLGVQSLEQSELKEAGRSKAAADVILDAISNVRRAGIPNLSTDLIIGFSRQTDETWDRSVSALLRLRPETISTYFLTIRPDAAFGRTGRYESVREGGLYRRYERARETFQAAGYIQESNVRYKLAGLGGYRQKVLQFRGVPVLGVGAGARSYTNSTDYLVGGGQSPRRVQVIQYMDDIQTGNVPLTSGFRFNHEERIRKHLALNLFDLNLGDIIRGAPDVFQEEVFQILDVAQDEGLVRQSGVGHYHLTREGYQYRDILSWMFFSPLVKERDALFYRRMSRGAAELVTTSNGGVK